MKDAKIHLALKKKYNIETISIGEEKVKMKEIIIRYVV